MIYNRNNFNNNSGNYNNRNNYNSPQRNYNAPNGYERQDSHNVWDNNPKLRDIDPLKLKIIMEIQKKSKNSSMEQLLPEIMKVNQELKRRNMSFSKQETEILLDVIEEGLSPEEKPRFNMLKGFMNM